MAEPAAAIAPEAVDLIRSFGLDDDDFVANNFEQFVRTQP